MGKLTTTLASVASMSLWSASTDELASTLRGTQCSLRIAKNASEIEFGKAKIAHNLPAYVQAKLQDPEAVKNGWPATVYAYQTRLDGYSADLHTKTSPEGRQWLFGTMTNGVCPYSRCTGNSGHTLEHHPLLPAKMVPPVNAVSSAAPSTAAVAGPLWSNTNRRLATMARNPITATR